MDASTTVTLIAAVGLAYVNGANDVSKGVAPLVGGRIAAYRRALVWGATWTAAGALLAAAAGTAMLATFGNALIAAGGTPPLVPALAALCGAAAWVWLATRVGLPVSTTHTLVGALVGVSVAAHSAEAVDWRALGVTVVLPLLFSPVVSCLLTGFALRTARARPRSEARPGDCLCAAFDSAIVVAGASAEAATLVPGPLTVRVETGTTEACAVSEPAACRLTLEHAHWLSSGMTSFARGMNDAPKIVGLALAGAVAGSHAAGPVAWLFAAVAAGMTLGSLHAGRRVTRVLAEDVTVLDRSTALPANLVTAGLVTMGAWHGWPMSTTHVALGAIAGAGCAGAGLNRRTLGDVAAAWVLTVPASAVTAATFYALGNTMLG